MYGYLVNPFCTSKWTKLGTPLPKIYFTSCFNHLILPDGWDWILKKTISPLCNKNLKIKYRISMDLPVGWWLNFISIT